MDLHKSIIERFPVGYAYHKIIRDENNRPCDYEFIEVNSAFENLTGLKRSDILGKNVSEVLPDIKKSAFNWIEFYGNIAINAGVEEFEQFSEPLRRWYQVKVYSPEKGYFITIFSDISNERRQINELELQITQRKLAEDKLRANEELLNASQRLSKVGGWEWNVETQAMYWTEETYRIHDFSPGEMDPGSAKHIKRSAECYEPKDRPVILAVFQRCVEEGQPYDLERPFTTAKGRRLWIRTTAIPVVESGKVIRVIGNIMDITDRKQVEQALRESETRYRKAQELGKVGNWEYNLKTTEFWGSDEAKKMYGFDPTKDNFSVEEVESCIIERERVHQSLVDLIENSKPYNLEFDIITKDTGKIKTFISIAELEKDKAGKPLKVSGVVQDITDRKKMEQLLFREKDQFKTTLLSVGDGIISTDVKGKVLILNPIAEQLTGWRQAEAVGRSSDEVFHIIDEFTRERCDNPAQKVIETGEIIELANHTHLISKDGFERPIEDSAAPIKDEQGNITGVVLVFRDFTEKKKIRDEITYLSFHDHLTGLYNRGFFEAEMERLDTERNLPITIVMGDVNGLKLINDSFGHAAGDELLIRIAKILKKSFRAADIIARVGGDEYAILLPKTDGSEAQKLINRTLELLLKEKVRDLNLSISFGWATKTDLSQTTDLVTKKAEDDMYNNKLFEGPSVRGRVIDSIVATINAKSPREQAHSERVSDLCIAIGEALKFEEGEIKTLKVFGLLHDIGKIAIADDILNKADGLTDKEYNEIKRHSEIGFRILSTANDMSEIADYVLSHHERWDGKGYPKGLAGESIPLPSRICAIADAYDAMTSDRSYRPALTHEFAVAELLKNSGKQFDSELVDIFVEKVLPTLRNRFC